MFVAQHSLHLSVVYSFEVQEKLEEFYTGGQVQVSFTLVVKPLHLYNIRDAYVGV